MYSSIAKTCFCRPLWILMFKSCVEGRGQGKSREENECLCVMASAAALAVVVL